MANMAYGEVKLGTDQAAGGGDRDYEDPDKLARPGYEAGRYESGQWQYESIPARRLQ